MEKLKIGLALGGGGARGLAHIGVLRVLEKNGIIPDYIAGTSMGAIIGAMYCSGLTPDEIEKKITVFLETDIYKRMKFESLMHKESESILKNIIKIIKQKAMFFLSGVRMAFLDKSVMEEMVSYFLPDIDFQDLKIPFACVAIDITQGSEVVIKDGSIQEGVASSMSIPGIMPPVRFNGHILVDGGAIRVIPAKVVKDMGCNFAIGVDVSSKLKLIPENELNSAFDVAHRTSYIAVFTLRQIQLKEADFLLSPDVKEVRWFELKKFSECILAGENEVKTKLSDLKNKINSNKFKTFIKQVFN